MWDATAAACHLNVFLEIQSKLQGRGMTEKGIERERGNCQSLVGMGPVLPHTPLHYAEPLDRRYGGPLTNGGRTHTKDGFLDGARGRRRRNHPDGYY